MTSQETTEPSLLRALGKPAAVALVVGSVIGSGIFLKPYEIAQALGRFDLIALVWVFGGLLCLLGALCIAELAAMLPRAGGLYVYLERAYGKLPAFLFGWTLFWVVRPAAVGALATGFTATLDIGDTRRLVVSLAVVILLAWVNIMGVAWGGRMQNVTTLIKAGFLLVVALLPLVLGHLDAANFASQPTEPVTLPVMQGFMMALLAVLWAYNSWHEITPLAEEIKDPARNIPWALLIGVGILIVLYVGANVAYHGVLSMDEVASHKNAAVGLLDRIFGPVGATVINILVMCSIFGAINANMMHAPRVFFAMGRDRVFFSQLGKVHPSRRTPSLAIASLASLAIVLMIFARFVPGETDVFRLLSNLVVFSASLFYVLAVAAVIVLRIRQPDLPRPYRTWAYPLPAVIFVLVYIWFLWKIFWLRPIESCYGLGIVATGIPAFYLWRRSQAGNQPQPS